MISSDMSTLVQYRQCDSSAALNQSRKIIFTDNQHFFLTDCVLIRSLFAELLPPKVNLQRCQALARRRSGQRVLLQPDFQVDPRGKAEQRIAQGFDLCQRQGAHLRLHALFQRAETPLCAAREVQHCQSVCLFRSQVARLKSRISFALLPVCRQRRNKLYWRHHSQAQCFLRLG